MGKFWCFLFGHNWRQYWEGQYDGAGGVTVVPTDYYCTRHVPGK